MSGSSSPAERGGSSKPPPLGSQTPSPGSPLPFVRRRPGRVTAGGMGDAHQASVPEGGLPKGEPPQSEDWFASVVRRFEQPLVLYALRITRDLERARDVVQEAFLKLIQAQRKDVEPHVAEWLYTVCRNKSLDIRRKEKRISPLVEGSLDHQMDEESAPGDLLEQRESAQEALRLMGQLPDNQQEVIRLRFQHGLSYQQISDVTGLSVSNVGFLLHTGLKSLRERMSRRRR